MSGEYSIRAASVGELGEMLHLAGTCAEAPRWSEAVWRDALEGGGPVERVVFVAQVSGVCVGFVVASAVWAGKERMAEIESVAVLPEYRRMGIGGGLCLRAMRWAREKGATEVELEVRASSMGALALYASLGFAEQGRRRAYYREPADDAVMMRAEVNEIR
jgi:ribosomal-protein-alanine N-acetyltransferase